VGIERSPKYDQGAERQKRDGKISPSRTAPQKARHLMLPHFIRPLMALHRLERAARAFDEVILRGLMANSYSLGSPNVCTRSPIERGDLVTRQFSDHLRWHVSSTHQRYFGDVITRHRIRILHNTSPADRNRRPRDSCWPPPSIPDFLFRVWPVGPCRSHSRQIRDAKK
jgi:hypothetical protein